MKTVKLNLSTRGSEIQIINDLIATGQKMVKIETLYKCTRRDFEKKFGFKGECPNFYVKDNMFWTLSYGTFVSRGRTFEYLDYIPMTSAKGKFKRYEING